MKAVILAAGYATRLYPLTLDRPKALLEVGGRTMLDRLLEQLEGVDGLDEVYVVTNSKFAGAIRDWALGVYDVGDLDAIRRYAVIELDADDRVTRLEEKPDEPRSTLAGIALYFYPGSALEFVAEYLAEGNNPDQPGRLVQWLYPRTPVYGWRVPGRWYDVGSKETLTEADQAFGGGG